MTRSAWAGTLDWLQASNRSRPAGNLKRKRWVGLEEFVELEAERIKKGLKTEKTENGKWRIWRLATNR